MLKLGDQRACVVERDREPLGRDTAGLLEEVDHAGLPGPLVARHHYVVPDLAHEADRSHESAHVDVDVDVDADVVPVQRAPMRVAVPGFGHRRVRITNVI